MKKYELTEEDIITFIGLAAEAVIGKNQQISLKNQVKLMGFAAEIADALLDHLNGENVFDEGGIEMMATIYKTLSKQMDK